MPIPPQYDSIFTWINQTVGDLHAINSELAFFQKYWTQFTPEQQTSIKALVVGKINIGISELTDIKAEIESLA